MLCVREGERANKVSQGEEFECTNHHRDELGSLNGQLALSVECLWSG